MIAKLRLMFRAMFRRRKEDADLSREFAAHIALERDHLIAQGVPAADAERRARMAFGSVDKFTEEVRDERDTSWLDGIAQDVRYGLRQCARAPWISATIVVMLALGIGANAFLLTVIARVRNAPIAGIANSESLVRIRARTFSARGESMRMVSYEELAQYALQTSVFSAVGGSTNARLMSAGSGDQLSTAAVNFVTSGFLPMLGVRPLRGRLLPADGDRVTSSIPAFISARRWQLAYGGADSAIGKAIHVGNAIATIVGVAPAEFTGGDATNSVPASVWVPYSAREAVLGRDEKVWFTVAARLRDGVSLEQADAVVRSIGARATTEIWGDVPANARFKYTTAANAVPLTARSENQMSSKEDTMLAFIGAAIALLVAVVIGTNLSALLLGRAAARRREVGVRLSLGASRARLVRQFLTESSILALAAGGIGLLLVAFVLKIIESVEPGIALAIPSWVVGVTVLYSMAVGVLVGLSPALHATRTSVFEALKGTSVASSRTTLAQRQLVTAQIALSQPLLVGLGVMVMALVQTERARQRSDVDANTVHLELRSGDRGGHDADGAGLSLAKQATAMLAAVPGVERVTIGTGWESGGEFELSPDPRAGIDGETFKAGLRFVGPDYFNVLNIRVIAGREFNERDEATAQYGVVIASDVAKNLFGSANPVGRQLRCLRYCDTHDFTVIGVVDADQAGSSQARGRTYMYVAALQRRNFSDPTMLVRVRGDGARMVSVLRSRMNEAFPNVPIDRATTVAELNSARRKESMMEGAIATACGVLALVLAAIGLYGVVSFAVNQRIREIGVRLALGARPGQVVAHFCRSGLKVSLIASVIGLPASALAVRGFMNGIRYNGPSVWIAAAIIALMVTGVAMLATWLPARRAASVDPLVALRLE